MGYSNLAEFYPAHSNNYTKGRLLGITEICLHHMAGVLTARQCGDIFKNADREGSSNYGIGVDGSICCYVDENNTAWANGNWDSNCRSISIECSNSERNGDWKVSDITINAAVKLIADICKRNHISELEAGKNLTWHSMYAATACPGDYLRSKMTYIAEEVNKIIAPVIQSQAIPNTHILSGINKGRGTDQLIVYNTSGNTSGTNQWGTEIIVDRNGVVLENRGYGKGNSKIPAGGCVISGHGEASKFVNNILPGYIVTYDTNQMIVYYSVATVRNINGTNIGRGTDQLIKYTGSGTTGTNQWGSEVQVSNDGTVLSNPSQSGNMSIPANGYVLSGHGQSGYWIKEHFRKGMKIQVLSGMVIVKK